ncbi:hypothetical protein BU15DRAFT_83943 [Melanogaster broomeanus]|nr:hypothetical protein BU15DRAFT_83943 [Melanogaster broomeanus]
MNPTPSVLQLLEKFDRYTKDGEAVKCRLQGERKQAKAALEELALSQWKLCEHAVEVERATKLPRYLDQQPQGLLNSKTIAQYVDRLKLRNTMKARLDKLDQQLKDVETKFRRSAFRDGSGFYGVNDYSQWARLKYDPLCDALGIASIFGAGITYTTIFSAPRGSIGLMCWSFSLFNVGFVVATLVQSLLRTTPGLPPPTKSKVVKFCWIPSFYEFLLQSVLLLAFGCVAVAVMLLSVTLLDLSPSGIIPSDVVWLAVVVSIVTTAGGLIVTSFVTTLYVCHFGVRLGENVEAHRVDTADLFL